jgi:hypothetical protein
LLQQSTQLVHNNNNNNNNNICVLCYAVRNWKQASANTCYQPCLVLCVTLVASFTRYNIWIVCLAARSLVVANSNRGLGNTAKAIVMPSACLLLIGRAHPLLLSTVAS